MKGTSFIFTNPLHLYTRGLFGCLPDIESVESKRLQIIPRHARTPRTCPWAASPV